MACAEQANGARRGVYPGYTMIERDLFRRLNKGASGNSQVVAQLRNCPCLDAGCHGQEGGVVGPQAVLGVAGSACAAVGRAQSARGVACSKRDIAEGVQAWVNSPELHRLQGLWKGRNVLAAALSQPV